MGMGMTPIPTGIDSNQRLYNLAILGLYSTYYTVPLHYQCIHRATVCKTVRPKLSDRCLSCLSVMSVTLVYCGQTVGCIRTNLGTEVGLSPGHIVLDGDPALRL